jgi:hypothetical protein
VNRTRLIVLVVAGLIALTVGIIGGQRVISSDISRSEKPRSRSSPRPPPDFVVFQGRKPAFTIAYPVNWLPLESPNPEVRLLATRNGVATVLVRVENHGLRLERGKLPPVRKVTREIAKSARRVEIVGRPERVKLGGLPGYFYSYTFSNPETRQRGAHAHYLLFKGDTTIALVFQALPAGSLRRYGPVFDQIATTFRG